ncbi:MAG: polymer-forming cytoskeletal protein [Rickettsiales bacterium]|nr:polymer-forming cytoskeletal protein [Rickettsiales bacterium]
MFSNKKGKMEINNLPSKSGVPSIVSADLSVLGNMISEGAIEIEGRIEGNLTCSQATIHKNGFIKGDIIADSVNINGEVRGLIKARNVRVSENGKVVGVIMYENLSIDPGGSVDGQCKNTDKLNKGYDLDKHSEEQVSTEEIKLIDETELA